MNSSSWGVSLDTRTRYEPTWSRKSPALSRSIAALVFGSLRAAAISGPQQSVMVLNSWIFLSTPFSQLGLMSDATTAHGVTKA